jgi:pyruvate/2-oxoglutarate dehydrogenase complex dihydrolipoamide dehydrogenase (E3) component
LGVTRLEGDLHKTALSRPFHSNFHRSSCSQQFLRSLVFVKKIATKLAFRSNNLFRDKSQSHLRAFREEWIGSHLLVALGSAPVTKDLDLAAAGVETTTKGFIKVNDRLETNVSGIWAIGDVSGGPQFTHASLDDFRILRDNVFGNGSRSRNGRYVPSTLFTDPELAHVGVTEKEAAARGWEFQVLQIPT